MKNIIVSKFGNMPEVFGESLRCGMIGDWEVRKLIKALANDKNNNVIYYGKAIWDIDKAKEYFTNDNVKFVECQTDDYQHFHMFEHIDEFHILLGPHAFYNGGRNLSSWESIKHSIVTERLLERVAPQLKLMNHYNKANCYFYLSDRRFLLQSADLTNDNIRIFAQCLDVTGYSRLQFRDDYSKLSIVNQVVEPFRFDTLWLLDKSYETYKKNANTSNRDLHLAISANQVTSNEEIEHSRMSKILEFTKKLTEFSIIGKWTNTDARNAFNFRSIHHWLNGVDIEEHQNLLQRSKYALVLFNTSDSPDIFINNYLTPKYWECVYNGCLTFVEGDNCSFIPKELQVKNGEELYDKLRKCDEDTTYKYNLLKLQDSLVKEEYFSGQYFTNWLQTQRS